MTQNKIPKVIHYVWVGDKEKPPLVLRCLKTWKKYCPDYEIVEWNNEKFEKIKNKYAQQAFDTGKWAFVSDYIRLYALYNYGGIYLDSDVEITQNIDKFLVHDFVSGFEKWENIYSPITAFMGAQKGNKIIKDFLNYYETHEFETKDGLDMKPNTERITEYFMENFGLQKPFDGVKTIELCKNCMIYPYYYFCTPEDGKENFAIHNFNGSWFDGYERKELLQLGKYKLLCLKYKENSKKEKSNFPITKKEKLILLYFIKKNKYIALIKL